MGPLCGHGVVNVTPTPSPTAVDGSTPPPPSSTASTWSPRAPISSTSGRVHPPGATRVDEAEELRRVIPVVRGLASEGVTVSVDTPVRASVAEKALAAGAALVNDVSGGLADPAMIPVVAAAGAPFVVMHWRGFLEGGNVTGVYEDVVGEVVDELRARVEAVLEGGVAPDRIVVDPGLGFSKEGEHDLALLARLDRLHRLGHRCSWPPRASVSSAAYWPARGARRRPRANATPPPPPSPLSPRTQEHGPCASMRYARRRTPYASHAPSKEPGEHCPHGCGTGRTGQHHLLRDDGAGGLRRVVVALARALRPRCRRAVPRPRRRRCHLLCAPRLARPDRPRRGPQVLCADHGEHRVHPVLPHGRPCLRDR